MLTKDDLEYLIYNTVNIVPQGEDSVFLGLFSLVDNQSMLDKVLSKVTHYYDELLATLPLTPTQRICLQVQRLFRYEEYMCLYNSSIKEQNYNHHAIFRTLLITNNAERLLFIRNKNRDDSFQSFLTCLSDWSEIYNPLVNALVYGIHD